MWRSLWCCMSKGIWGRSDLNGLSSVRSSGSHHVFHQHQLIWGGLEVLVDSYCSSWSRFWCVFVLLCLQQMQECSSSAQMNHRVEVWFLFVILIDWIESFGCLTNLELAICIWIMNFVPIQFIWFAQYNLVLGSSDLYWFVVFQKLGLIRFSRSNLSSCWSTFGWLWTPLFNSFFTIQF